jgi:hypothetical protein
VAGTEPREVAGLGRPETPAEKNERVTKARAERRARQTTRNLVWSLLSSLGIVALLIIVVVRPDANLIESVDYQAVAKEISSEVPSEPITPQLSELWSANRAEISREPGAEITWSIGLLGPESSYVFIDQGFEADASWVSLRTELTLGQTMLMSSSMRTHHRPSSSAAPLSGPLAKWPMKCPTNSRGVDHE